MYTTRPKTLVFLLLIFFSTISANANSFWDNFSWAAHGSIFYFAANNGKQGADPAPIMPSLGFSASYRFFRFFKVEITEDLYFYNYEFNSELGYPMAANPENRSAFVLGFLTGIQAVGYFPIADSGIVGRVYGGPGVDLRVVTLAFGLNHPADFTGKIETDAQMQTDAIREYFWSEARWFYPVAGVGMDFPISERFQLGFDIRAWFPMYRLWTDDHLPSIDGWRFGAGFRITPRKVPKQSASPSLDE